MTSLKILVVDDEEVVRDTLKQFFDYLGYQVDCAEDGNSGLRALENRCYDVALVDIRMPKLNGMDFLRRSKEIRPNMPVVIITGHGSDSTRKEALAAGAFSFFQKPFRLSDIQELMDRIESASYSSP